MADEDFDGRIVRGLRARLESLDLVRVQDIGLAGASDVEILEWAEAHGRVLLTRDARTIPRHVRDRLLSGQHLPGVFVVHDRAPIGASIDDLLLILECRDPSEWRDRIQYLPWK